jgi:hypothetical protein
MKLRTVLMMAFATATGTLIACSSGSTSTSNGNDAGTAAKDDSGTTGDTTGGDTTGGDTTGGDTTGGDTAAACKVPAGTYTATYTQKTGNPATCTDLPSSTFEIKDTPADGGSTQTPNCTTSLDTATCTTTTKCETKTAGMTSTTSLESTYKNGAVSGSQATKMVKDSDGSVTYNCGYDYTWTKK